MAKLKIQINDNFNSIYNFIITSQCKVTYKELIQFCMDYQCYQELYINLAVWKCLLEEKNEEFKDEKISVKKGVL